MWILIGIAVFIVFVLAAYLIIDSLKISDIKGKAVLITGCGAGFGKALVEKCLNEGMTVFAGCRREESVHQLAREFKCTKGHLDAFKMDIKSATDVRSARKYVEEQLKKLDKSLFAIVNNAGVQGNCFFDDFLDVEDYEDAMQVNTFGVIRVTQTFKKMIKESGGRVIICTSSAVRFPPPGMGPYVVSKCATTCYSDVVRNELRPYGVKVCVLEPGIYQTPLNDYSKLESMLDTTWSRAPTDIRDEYGEECLKKAKKAIQLMLSHSSTDLTPVINTYFHALTARFPHYKYAVGRDCILLFRPYSWLSPCLQEIVMRIFLRIVDGPVPISTIKQKA